jgi:hypothetical protein
MDGRITSGNQATGRGGTVSACGYVVIMWCEDTELLGFGVVLPGRDQSTQQAEKSADQRFRKIVAL